MPATMTEPSEPAAPPAPDLAEVQRRERHWAAGHEAGHLCASVAFAEEYGLPPPPCWASIYVGGSGTAYGILEGLSLTAQDVAVHAACGLLAERLASEYPLPDVETEPLRLDPDTIPTDADGGGESAKPRIASPRDEESIHRYVTGSVAGGISTMISRHRTVFARARGILKERRSLLLALTEELFRTGRLRMKDVRRIAGTRPAPAGRNPAKSPE